MQNDTNKVLERMSEELLSQEEPSVIMEDTPDIPQELPQNTDETMVLPTVTPEGPAFDDPQTIHEPEDTMIYCNFSNGYGRDLLTEEEEEEELEAAPAISKDDKINIGLMLTACGLCLGIIGVLIYWLAAYLR